MNFNRCWVKHDAGAGVRVSPTAKSNDCTIRAYATACAVPYREAWRLLYAVQGELEEPSFRLPEWMKAYPDRFGVLEYLSFPARRGRLRMNGARFCTAYPSGRFILSMPHHVAAVVDGQLFDSWNSSSRCVYGAWRMEVFAKVEPQERAS